jgi:hypothetical protein
MGMIMSPSMASATTGLRPEDAGVGSAMVNTTQQVGGSVGTALLSTLVASAISSDLEGVAASPQAIEAATIHGYTTAFWWSAAIFGVGALVCGLVMRPGAQEIAPGAVPALAH